MNIVNFLCGWSKSIFSRHHRSYFFCSLWPTQTKTETKTCLYCILITHLQDHNTLSEKYSSCRSKTKRHPWLIIVHSFHSFHSSTFLSTAGILDRWELGIWTCARPGEVRPLILRLSLSSWEVKSVLEGWDTSFDWKTSVGMLDWNNMDI